MLLPMASMLRLVSYRAPSPSKVSIAGGVQAVLLAPASFVAAAFVAFMPSSLPLAGPVVYVTAIFGMGLFVAALGIAAGAVSVSKARHSPLESPRRDAAIGIGIWGIALSGLAALALVALWIYVPSQISYTPLWS